MPRENSWTDVFMDIEVHICIESQGEENERPRGDAVLDSVKASLHSRRNRGLGLRRISRWSVIAHLLEFLRLL